MTDSMVCLHCLQETLTETKRNIGKFSTSPSTKHGLFTTCIEPEGDGWVVFFVFFTGKSRVEWFEDVYEACMTLICRISDEEDCVELLRAFDRKCRNNGIYHY